MDISISVFVLILAFDDQVCFMSCRVISEAPPTRVRRTRSRCPCSRHMTSSTRTVVVDRNRRRCAVFRQRSAHPVTALLTVERAAMPLRTARVLTTNTHRKVCTHLFSVLQDRTLLPSQLTRVRSPHSRKFRRTKWTRSPTCSCRTWRRPPTQISSVSLVFISKWFRKKLYSYFSLLLQISIHVTSDI